MKTIDLMELQDKYDGDISLQTNHLTRLSDAGIINTLEENFQTLCTFDKSPNQRLSSSCRVIYHKVLWRSNTKRRENEVEGWFSIHLKSGTKYFTSWKYVSKFLIENKIKPNWEVRDK